MLSILGKASPWASSPTAALNELRGLGLGYTEKTFREDWVEHGPGFYAVEAPTPFEQRYAYYYDAYLRDPEGNEYVEHLAHYTDTVYTREELEDVLEESWKEEAEPYVAGTPAEAGEAWGFMIRGASVKTGWLGTRPLE